MNFFPYFVKNVLFESDNVLDLIEDGFLDSFFIIPLVPVGTLHLHIERHFALNLVLGDETELLREVKHELFAFREPLVDLV